MSEIEVRSPRAEHHIENRSAVHRDLDNTVMSEAETRPPTSFGCSTSSSSSASDRTLTDRQSLTAQKRTPRALTTHSSRVITPEPQSKRRKHRIRGKDSARSQKSLKASTTSSEDETKQMVETEIPFWIETLDMSDNRRELRGAIRDELQMLKLWLEWNHGLNAEYRLGSRPRDTAHIHSVRDGS